MENATLGKKISFFRKYYNLTQTELAQQLHLTDKAVSKWESDENKPGIDDISKLTQIFKISLSFLIEDVATKEDVILIKKANIRNQYIENEKNIKTLLKKHNIKQDIADLFYVEGSAIIGCLDKIIAVDNYNFYTEVREKCGLCTIENLQKAEEIVQKKGRDYELKLDDLYATTDIGFYDEVIRKLEYKNTEIEKRNKSLGELGHSPEKTEDIPELLSRHLSNLDAGKLGRKAYEVFKYLVGKGALITKEFFCLDCCPTRVEHNLETGLLNQLISDVLQLQSANLSLKQEIDAIKAQLATMTK